MTETKIALPFLQVYKLEGGRRQRTIQDRDVALRTVAVGSLTKAARSPRGSILLEYEGLALNYIGKTPAGASLDALRETMEKRARYTGGVPT